MKRRARAALGLLSATATLWISAPAAADLPPPRDYVETCALERYEAAGGDCVACQGGGTAPVPCADRPEIADGRARCCTSWGASVNTEVWCADDCPSVGAEIEADDAPPTSAPGAEGGCSCRVANRRGPRRLAPLLLCAVWLVARRRSPAA